MVCDGIRTEDVDILRLGCDLRNTLDLMEITVYEGIALMEIALTESGAFVFVGFVLPYLLEAFGMYATDGDAHATDIHNELAVACHTDYVAFKSGIIT